MRTPAPRSERSLPRGGVLAAVVMLIAGSAEGQVPSGRAPGDAPTVVVLHSPSCAATSTTAERFAQLLAVELSIAQLRLARDVPAPSADLLVEVNGAICDASAREVGVSIIRPQTGARTGQTVALHDVEENARPRALALAVAELVRAARSHSLAEPARADSDEVGQPVAVRSAVQDVPSRPVPIPVAPPQRVDEEPLFAGTLQAAGAWRIFAPESTPLTGASIAAGLRLRPTWLRVHADIAGSWGSVVDPLGDVSVSLYSGGLTLLAVSGRHPELEIGPHFELGYARAVGLASGPSSVSKREGHAVALVSLTTGARFWFDRWAALVEIDLGTAILGAEVFADNRRVAAVQGAFACARAGIAFGF